VVETLPSLLLFGLTQRIQEIAFGWGGRFIWAATAFFLRIPGTEAAMASVNSHFMTTVILGLFFLSKIKLFNTMVPILRLFIAPLFHLGNTPISIEIILKSVLFIFIVLIISHLIGRAIGHLFLTRMGLDRGSREAITSVIRYALVALGSIVVLHELGIDLSSLAVIAGVVGLGVGIGLQNLSSNFISGLTLLFERPVKVGDFVAVDELLGTVEKISFRSTIVRSLDGVFAIVPNSHFVDRKVVNWSYCDPRCRLHIPIGVAYGTDPVLVTEALISVAHLEDGVLRNPSPKVWFKSFGEHSLNFELLVWIDSPPDKELIHSSLNFRIEYEFRKRGIIIPFPQQDVWIRGWDAKIPQDLLPNWSLNPTGNGNLGDRDFQFNPSVHVAPKDAPPSNIKSPNNWTLRELLRRISYFEGCTDLELRKLIEYGYRQVFPKGQIICQENDPGDSFYIILTGSVEVISQRAGQYIATLHQGEFFGEMSLLMGLPRTATVRTIDDSVLFIVEHHDLQKLLTEQPSLADEIAQKLSERQQALRELGLLVNENSEETPFVWIRKRLKILFEI
jgi:potassium-dependent mechanosensitive channel